MVTRRCARDKIIISHVECFVSFPFDLVRGCQDLGSLAVSLSGGCSLRRENEPHLVEGLLRGEALLARTLDAVRSALEAKGVEFAADGGVKLAEKAKGKRK
jgi:hypothetical protein